MVSLDSVFDKADGMLYAEYARPNGMASLPDYRTIQTLAGCIDSPTYEVEDEVRALLRGDESTGSKVQFDARATPIRRVEIFCDEHVASPRGRMHDRGLVLFDNTGRPIVHVFHALIGYNGSAPSVTKAILDELSIPERIFEEIQATFRGIRNTDRPYYVVIQGTGDHYSPEWEWWSVTPPSVAM
jgi:hypothetical protein